MKILLGIIAVALFLFCYYLMVAKEKKAFKIIEWFQNLFKK